MATFRVVSPSSKHLRTCNNRYQIRIIAPCQQCFRGLTMIQIVSPTTYLKQTNRLSTMTRQFAQLQSKHVGSKSDKRSDHERERKEKRKRNLLAITERKQQLTLLIPECVGPHTSTSHMTNWTSEISVLRTNTKYHI